MDKTLNQMITETEQRIAGALNDSHLAPEILLLIIRNVEGQLMSIINSPQMKPEDNKDGEHSSVPSSDI